MLEIYCIKNARNLMSTFDLRWPKDSIEVWKKAEFWILKYENSEWALLPTPTPLLFGNATIVWWDTPICMYAWIAYVL